MKGKVYLVGAGPGDFKLLTLRALECIKNSDVIIYDRLANSRVLGEAKKDCEFIYVGKASSNHTLSQDRINELILKKALDGKVVTRLKGGDPYVFGRGGEEAEILYDKKIEFEVVPGVTSAIGGLCYAGIPVTYRCEATSFHVVTGHTKRGNCRDCDLDWKHLAELDGTIVFLMGVSNIKAIVENLIQNGKEETTPVAFVSWATRHNQRVVVTNLNEAYEVAIRDKIKSPSLIVVGEVVKHREKLNFFEKKKLFGKSIAVTRARKQNKGFIDKIDDLGGNAIEMPLIRIEEILENTELKKAIKNLKDYTHLIFTSKNTVEIFFKNLGEMNLDSRELCGIKICSIGTSTTELLRSKGIIPDITTDKFVAENLFEKLKSTLCSVDRVLITGSANARNFLLDNISKICKVDNIFTYKTVIDNLVKEDILADIRNGNLDYITFTSSSTVKNFVKLIGNENLKLLKDTKVVSIGPMTTATAKKLGVNVYKEAKVHNIDGMIETILEDSCCQTVKGVL